MMLRIISLLLPVQAFKHTMHSLIMPHILYIYFLCSYFLNRMRQPCQCRRFFSQSEFTENAVDMAIRICIAWCKNLLYIATDNQPSSIRYRHSVDERLIFPQCSLNWMICHSKTRYHLWLMCDWVLRKCMQFEPQRNSTRFSNDIPT